MGIYFIGWDITHHFCFAFYLKLFQIWSSGTCSNQLLYSFYMLLSCSKGFLTSWSHKMFQFHEVFFHKVFFPLLALDSTTDLRSLGSFYWKIVFTMLLLLLLSLQSCPTLCDPKDSSPPGSPVLGILQGRTLEARTLEWVATSFSNA